jgi:putative membrane protein
MMSWYGDGMGGWGYALMTVSSVLFWALGILAVVTLVWYLARSSGSRDAGIAPERTPEQLLAQRFARGEIDEQEYHSRLATLRGTHHAAS